MDNQQNGHSNGHHEGDKPTSISDYTASHSSGDGSDSTPNTPPSPVAVLVPNQLPMVEPHITVTPTTSPKKDNRSPKRNATPRSRLGAIDEDTDLVSPDVPVRNPRRLLPGSSRLFALAFPPTLHGSRRQPRKLWDDVEGPKGEKFSDLRRNRQDRIASRGGWRRVICLALLLFGIGLIVMIVLLAVLLTRHKHNNSSQSNTNNNNNNAASAAFPAGTYQIGSYLTTITTNCTSNSATWRCAPDVTYSQSASSSYTTLQWNISTAGGSSSSPSYQISSTDSTFTYPFANIPLTLTNQGLDNEAYTFTYTYTKSVLPFDPLPGSNDVRAICYYNNTLLTGRMFTRMAKQPALLQQSNNASQWPFALEFEETISAGNEVPNCYQWTNAVAGNSIDVSPVTSGVTGSGASCECAYTNYGV